jgi:patatin-like phospholipase/acyl hydrolase
LAWKFQQNLQAQFDERPLAKLLKSELGDITLGSNDYRCGLMVVAKRADTASVWPLVNIPTQKYFEFNKHLTLWEILRASTAAPTFFRPHKITDVGLGEQGVFVDGAISMHNSPALQLLMVASLAGFGLNWTLAQDQLLLCSIGTGSVPKLSTVKMLDVDRNLSLLPVVMTQLLFDAAELNTTILQWLSQSPTAKVIDSQIGDLNGDLLAGKPLLRLLRYDFSLTPET